MAEEKSGVEPNSDSVVLEEEIDPNYVPGEEEVIEYAKWLGMDLVKDEDLYWIAREGLMAPLPKNWKPCKTKGTEEIYYFNFLSGESTWDHPCDGYYKRLYEEEKKKKEVSLKENADTKRAKAKQDVQDLLGKDKDDKKKGKKSKKKSVLGAIGGSGGGGELGPPGRGLGQSLPLGSKPLPVLGKSLDMPPLGALKSAGALGSIKSSGTAASLDSVPTNSLSMKNPLKKSISSLKAEEKVSENFSDDSDSDSEAPEAKPESSARAHKKSLGGPQQSASPKKVSKSKSSRVNDRLQSALLSDSEEFSSIGGSLEAEEKLDRGGARSRRLEQDSPDMKPLSSYSSGGQHDLDSPLPVSSAVVKKKLNFGQDAKADEEDFVKHQYAGHGDGDRLQQQTLELERERRALQADREALNSQKQQFKQDEANFKLEKDMLERERSLLDKEKSVFSTDRATLRRERSEAEDIRDTLTRDKDAFLREKERDRQMSSRSSGDQSAGGPQNDSVVRRLEQELSDLQREMDALRREKNAIAADLSKAEKTLESEKQLRNAGAREADELSAASRREREEALTKVALLEVDKKSLEGQVLKLKKSAVVLTEERGDAEDEVARLKKSLAETQMSLGGSDDGAAAAIKKLNESLAKAEDHLSQKSSEISSLKNTVAKMAMQIIDANDQTEKTQVKLKFVTAEGTRVEEELASLQAEKRQLKRSYEDTLDELSRVKRDTAVTKRREEEQAEELGRLRPLAQQVRELESSLETEQTRSRRASSERESALEDLADARRRCQELQLQLEDAKCVVDDIERRHDGDRAKTQNQNEEVNALMDQIGELKAKIMTANAARVDQASMLDESDNKIQALQKKASQFQAHAEALELQLSKASSAASASVASPSSGTPAPAALSSSSESQDAVNEVVAEWQAKVTVLERKMREVEEERDSVEERLQSSKTRANKLQAQIDSLEADLVSHQSKLRHKSSAEEELKETVERLSSEVQKCKEMLQSSKAQADILEDNERELRKSVRHLSEEKVSLEAERTTLVQEKQRLAASSSARVQALEAERDSLEQALADSRSRYEEKLRAAAASSTSAGESVTSSGSAHNYHSDAELVKSLADLQSSKSSLDREQKKSQELQRQVDSLTEQLHNREAELLAATSLLEEKSHTPSSSPSTSKNHVDVMSTFALQEIKQLKEELHNERKQNNSLQSDVADLEFRLRRSEQTVQELRVQVSDNDESSATQQQKVRQYQDEILVLQQRLHAAEISSQQSAKNSSSSSSSSPQHKQMMEFEKLEALQKLEDSHLQQLRPMQALLDELHSEKTQLMHQLHTLKSAHLVTTNQLEEAQFQAKMVQQTLQNSNQQCEAFEVEIERMKTERHHLLTQGAEHNSLIADLRRQVISAAADKDVVHSSAEVQASELYRLREEVLALQGKLSVADQRGADSLREINAMKETRRLEALASATGGAPSAGSDGSRSLSLTSSSMDEMRIRDLRLENERLAVELSQSATKLGAAETSIVALQQETASLRARLTEVQKDYAALQEQFKRKQDEVSRLYEMNSNNSKAIKLLSSADASLTSALAPADHPSQAFGTREGVAAGNGLARNGQEENMISELQTHRLEWEEALKQQNALVLRLEEKLKDTEHTLNFHIQHQQMQQHLQQQQQFQQLQMQEEAAPRQHQKSLQPSPPTSPKYPFSSSNSGDLLGSSRPHKEQSRSPRIYQQYISSLRGFNSQLEASSRQGVAQPYVYQYSGGDPSDEEKYKREYGVEIETRLQDLTFEQEEVSDEEDLLQRVLAGKQSGGAMAKDRHRDRDGSSAISVLKEVLLDLIHRETRSAGGGRRNGSTNTKPRSESHAKANSRRQAESSAENTYDWRHKIRKEKTLIFNVKKALKLENIYIKQVQDNLTKQREGWKIKKEAIKEATAKTGSAAGGGGGGGDSSGGTLKSQREMLKDEGDRLNKRATQLNDLVHQIRRTQGWIVEREKKISKLENMVASQPGGGASSGAETDLGAHSPLELENPSPISDDGGDTTSSLERHVEKMRQLEAELEQDLTVLGEEASSGFNGASSDDSIPTPDFNHHAFYHSDKDMQSTKAVGKGAGGSSRSEGGKERGQRLRFDADVVESKSDARRKQAPSGSERPVLKSLPLQGDDRRYGDRRSGDTRSSDGGGGRSGHASAQQQSQHLHQKHQEQMEFPQYYHPSHQQQPSLAPQHYSQQPRPYYEPLHHHPSSAPPPPPPAVVGITANHFAERFDNSAHQLSTYGYQQAHSNNENYPNMAASGSMVESVRRGSSALGVAGGKGSIRSMVEHRSKSAEAAENHVSWLDNLRKEISQFPHSSSSTSIADEYARQPFGDAVLRSAGGEGYDQILHASEMGRARGISDGGGGGGSDRNQPSNNNIGNYAVYRV